MMNLPFLSVLALLATPFAIKQATNNVKEPIEKNITGPIASTKDIFGNDPVKAFWKWFTGLSGSFEGKKWTAITRKIFGFSNETSEENDKKLLEALAEKNRIIKADMRICALTEAKTWTVGPQTMALPLATAFGISKIPVFGPALKTAFQIAPTPIKAIIGTIAILGTTFFVGKEALAANANNILCQALYSLKKDADSGIDPRTHVLYSYIEKKYIELGFAERMSLLEYFQTHTIEEIIEAFDLRNSLNKDLAEKIREGTVDDENGLYYESVGPIGSWIRNNLATPVIKQITGQILGTA